MTQQVDVLLTNATVLTIDEEFNQYPNGAVAIQDNHIVAVGPKHEINKQYTAKEVVDCEGSVLMPGLVNAHTHAAMTLLRGLADDLRLDVWLMGYMMPVEREYVSPEFVRLGTQIACAEFIRSGVTTFADMYYFEEEVAKATADAGLRALCTQTVLKFPAPDAQSYEDSLAYTRKFIQRWKDHPLIVPGVAPHAAYTSTAEILQECSKLAVEFDVPLHIHIAEAALEVENMRREADMPVVPYIKKQNLFDAKVLAAHCVHIDSGEIHTLLHHGAGVAHNPSSNLKLASGAAPVDEMLHIGLNVGIGTDGPASNNDLDMFEEIRLASFLSKHSTGDPTSLPARTTLAMATRLGAQAMHIGHLTGSLEVGKRADLILVKINTLHNSPHFRRDPDGVYAQLVYAGKATDVTDVMVDGKWLMRDHRLTTLDEAELMIQAQLYASEIDAFLIEREQSLLSKLVAIGGAMEGESFEVQIKVRLEDPKQTQQALQMPEFDIVYHKNYREYDTYFMFDDEAQGQLRIREDEKINHKGEVESVRYRLTLVGEPRQREFTSDVMLSRSRFLAEATHSLQFYREYFKPEGEIFIKKDRLRWLVKYKGTDFYVNIDTVEEPDLGSFLEVKSRTWSRKDAERKSELIAELVELLGASPKETVKQDYVEIAANT